jgi:hypothetical protein
MFAVSLSSQPERARDIQPRLDRCRPRNSPKPFSEFAVHRGMYGKVSRSSFLSFLSYIGHGVAVICQFVEIQLTPR